MDSSSLMTLLTKYLIFISASWNISSLAHVHLSRNDLPIGAIPTKRMIQWGQAELGTIIHFNMESMMADQPDPQQFCTNVGGIKETPLPPPDTFYPSKLDVEQWVQAASDFGAK